MIKIKHKATGKVLKEVDANTLKDADLKGADLWGADLSGADLSGADLSGADLSGADLSGANLLGAYLRVADLRDTDLRGAIEIKLPTLQSQKESRQMEIPDRLPTEDDANEEGNVYVVGTNMLSKWNTIDTNDTWLPLPRLPKSRDELVQDLLDAIDVWNTTGRMDVSHGHLVVKAREALR